MITALTPPANGNQALGYLNQARQVADRLNSATNAQAAPAPSFEEISDGAQAARVAGEWLGANASGGGCIYGPAIESAAILAKAGADALTTAANGLTQFDKNVEYQAMRHGAVVGSTTLDAAIQDLVELPDGMLGIEDGTPCGH